MAKAKKAAKKNERTDAPDGIEFVLEGKVFVVDTKNGKSTREELDGKLVLEALVDVVRRSLR